MASQVRERPRDVAERAAEAHDRHLAALTGGAA